MKSSIQMSKFIFLLLVVSMFASTSTSAQGVTVNARAYLQGALMNSVETGTSHDRPLMRDDLRDNPFNNTRLIPDDDIYQTVHDVNAYISIDITNSYTHVACGTYPQYKAISDPFTVFAVTGENAIVDWVFVELRDKNDYTSVVATRSGLVQRDGDIVDLDGTSGLFFPDVTVDSYFVVVRHRNHLGVMTKFPLTPETMESLVDFSDLNLDVFDFANSSNEFNYAGLAMNTVTIEGYELRELWGGDLDANGKIVYRGKDDDLTVIHKEVAGFDLELNPMRELSFDLAIGYLQGDFDMNGKTKFDNPFDDRNALLTQVVLYPQNEDFLNNFVHLIAQLP
ncbi:MAG: hypothetical protein P1U56_09680 [Saprospiraceae bacterium]|nr:hypothetical protein [Saprospiraceae bacterium]